MAHSGFWAASSGARWLTGVGLWLALAAPAPAATRHVRPGGTGPAPYASWAAAAATVSEAVSVAGDGDDVLVSNGTYALGMPVVITNAVVVRGVGGAAVTILDGGGAARCIEIRHAAAAVEGFTITRGLATVGGGVYLGTGGTLRACRVVENRATAYGGGVECDHGGWLLSCVIESNRAVQVGGIDLDSGGVVSGCLIRANAATDTCGGVFGYYGGSVLDSVISDNTAVSNGGGVYLKGGGMVSNCTIRANVASQGGGVNIDYVGTVVNCVLSGNQATDGGGGAYLYFGGDLRYSTVHTNRATSAGGGVYCQSGGRVVASIVSGNSAADGANWYDAGSNAVFLACCSQPVRPGVTVIGGPGFLDPEQGDYRLAPGSPCIDSASGGGPCRDRQGYPRPLDGDADGTNSWDIGALEHAGLSSDTDGDSMSDAWELAGGLSPISAAGDDGGSGDPDADRVSNWDEYAADTRPHDSYSFLRLVGVHSVGGGVELVWGGGRDAVQYVETRQDLRQTSTTWVAIATNYPPSGEWVASTISGPIGPQAVFRIRAERP